MPNLLNIFLYGTTEKPQRETKTYIVFPILPANAQGHNFLK